MRILTIAGFVVLVLSWGGATAQADGAWCYRDADRTQADCDFSTAHQCLSIARIVGGVCERNSQADSGPVPKKKAKSRS